jgi:(R,R)-butanediol dehydrogenase/meso-butanediol dehydrogenase/diacetyl reductase
VFGGGPIGAVTIQCLRAMGAGQIMVAEVSKARKEKALQIGADAVIDPTEEDVAQRVREMTGGEGAEHSFDAAGIQQTLQTALHATCKGGTVTIVSIWEGPVQIDPNDIVLSELNVDGTICYTPEDFDDTIAMLKTAAYRPRRSSPSGSPSPMLSRGVSRNSWLTRTATSRSSSTPPGSGTRAGRAVNTSGGRRE